MVQQELAVPFRGRVLGEEVGDVVDMEWPEDDEFGLDLVCEHRRRAASHRGPQRGTASRRCPKATCIWPRTWRGNDAVTALAPEAMKKLTSSNYTKDQLYPVVARAIAEILKTGSGGRTGRGSAAHAADHPAAVRGLAVWPNSVSGTRDRRAGWAK